MNGLNTSRDRDQCTIVNDGEHKIKDLAKLRPRPLESIVILDDNPMSSKLQVNPKP